MSIRLRLGPFSVTSRGRVGVRVGPVSVSGGGARRKRNSPSSTRSSSQAAFERQIADGDRWLRKHPQALRAAGERIKRDRATQRAADRLAKRQSRASSKAAAWWQRRGGVLVVPPTESRGEVVNNAPTETPLRVPEMETSGRTQYLEHLHTVMTQARRSGAKPPHVLLSCPAGTAAAEILARTVADELGASFVSTSGTSLGRAGDLAVLLCNFGEDGLGVLFIDEAHRMRDDVEAMLISVLEDGVLTVHIGTGHEAKSVGLALAPIVFVISVETPGSLSGRLRNCFGFHASAL